MLDCLLLLCCWHCVAAHQAAIFRLDPVRCGKHSPPWSTMFSASPDSTRPGSLAGPRSMVPAGAAPMLASMLTLMLPLMLALLAILACGAALAADDAPESANADTLQYTVRIQAPQPLAQLLEKNLDLMRFRGNARIDRRQLQRLIRAAPQQIETLVATEGFYMPEIKAALDAGSAEPVVVIEVTPGEPVRVDSVDLVLQGFEASASDAPFDTAAIKESWSLKPDQIFRQADWEAAKRNLLRQVLQTRYAHAQLSASQAAVDPETHRAKLRVVLDSGPELRFGDLRIEGLQRYPASVVADLNQIKPGDYYSEAKLQAYQARLQESTYFSSVEVSADLPPRVEPASAAANQADANTEIDAATPTTPEPSAPVAEATMAPPLAPLLVRVTENKLQNVSAGLGYSSNTGNRAQLSYDNLSLFDLKFKSALMLETKRQTARGTFYFPITPKGYNDSVGASFERSDIAGETTSVSTVAAKRVWGSTRIERSLTFEFLNEVKSVAGLDASTSKSLPLTYGITLRRLDSLLFPSRGYVLHAQLGGALLPLLTDEKFVRANAKFVYYHPLGKDAKLILRGEAGALGSKEKVGVPSVYLFRAGGDQSVRGYGFQELGVQEGNAIVGGRYLATGGAELQYWLTPTWGAATFYDAGNAADTIKDLHPKSGYGIGARYNSPVGPINVDLAYGHAVQKYRLHFSLGFTF
jgi:translocation and assembly module TamA